MRYDSSIAVLAAGGWGDCLCAVQHAKVVKDAGYHCSIIALVRDEVFKPLRFLIGDNFSLTQHPTKEYWMEDYRLFKDSTLLNELKEIYDYVFFDIFDTLCSNREFTFDYKAFNCHPSTVRKERVCQNIYQPEKRIYLALNSVTEGYSHYSPHDVAREIARLNPDYIIYYPIITEWSGKPTKQTPFKGDKPDNLIVVENPDFCASIEQQRLSCYSVVYDCGSLHSAYALGQPYTLLDPRFELNSQNIMFWSRWRPDLLNNSIPLQTSPNLIARLVKTNLDCFQTTFLPRKLVLDNSSVDWKSALNIKF